MKVIETTNRTIDLSGIDDHTVRNLAIVTAGGVVRTGQGEIIVILHQAADMTRDARTILSSGQMESFGCTVDDRSPHISSEIPHIRTSEGYTIPIQFRKGLPFIKLRRFDDDDWATLPHVHITSPQEWDPAALDTKVSEEWYNSQQKGTEFLREGILTETGELKADLEDDGVEDMSDRNHQAVDRGSIRAYLSDLISDEMGEGFILCEGEGTVHTFEYVPNQHDCFFAETYDVQAASTRSGKAHLTEPRPAKPRRVRRVAAIPDTVTDEEPSATEDIPISDGDVVSSEATKETDIQPGEESNTADTGETHHGSDYNNPSKELRTVSPGLEPPGKRNLARYAMYLPGSDLSTIKRTFEATTQLGTRGAVQGINLRDRILSPNPVLNIPRRNEDVATDTVYSNVPAIDDGSTAAQFFIGRQSHYRSILPMGHSDKHFAPALMDVIRQYGAMDRLISDNAKAQISERVKDILRTYCIKDWQSEPYKGNQNFAERGWKDTKTRFKNAMNANGVPPNVWLLLLTYICEIQNHTAVASLKWRTPTEWLLGYTPDITVFLQFRFYEPVYYATYDAKFPSDSSESLGRFVGIGQNVGHAMTFKILTAGDKLIHRSVVRSAVGTGAFRNRIADTSSVNNDTTLPVDNDAGNVAPLLEDDAFTASAAADVIHARRENDGEPIPILDTSALLGRTFIDDPDVLGEQRRATIDEIIPTDQTTADQKHQLFRFRAKIGELQFEHLLTYHKMVEWCERDRQTEGFYKIDGILAHRKAPKAQRGYEVEILWQDGTKSWNDMGLTFIDDPVSISLYALKNDLLNTPGWKSCKRYTRNAKQLSRMVNQAKLRSLRNRPIYKYGFQVPRNHNEAARIDAKMGNSLWAEAEKTERDQLFEYNTFEDKGKHAPVPEGYQKIPTHFVYDIKHDGRHKARMVAGGHRTETPVDSVYSGVVTLTGVRTVVFLAELNKMDLWATDIGNAYLESYTKEKVAFTAGPEFGEYEGHTFVIVKALYGLRSSGARWHDRLYDALTGMGFTPSLADADIWMREQDDHYEYIACYVDDLMIASRNPKAIIDALTAHPNKFKLKGTGPVSFHLGNDFFRDDEGVMCMGPRKYIERMMIQYETMFGTKPKGVYTSPLLSNDHPELDTSELLDDDGIHQYQSLIGALQWTITLGRLDIATAVMTMSGFRVAPRVNHLERLKRICGYLSKMKHGFIRFRTDEPDYSMLDETTYDWARTVYGKVKEELPKNAPKPKGRYVVTTTYVDANLYHDMLTGRSVTAILHLLNQTPVDWFSKKQATVETATYGSEFVAAKTAVQQIIGLRTFLRYLGVEVRGPSRLFGDNGSVVKGGATPHSVLKKRHHALSYHYTREAVASKAVDFQFIPGHLNPADILSKHWGYQQVWASALRPLLFWKGDTSNLLVDNEQPHPRSAKEVAAEVGNP